MAVVVPLVPETPPVPLRNEKPELFNPKADNWFSYWGTLRTTFNASITGVNAAVQQCEADRVQTGEDRVAILTLRNQVQALAISALNAPGTLASSVTEMALTAGVKTIFIQQAKALVEGPTVSVAVEGDGSKRAEGPILSYNPATGELRFDAERVFGVGTFSSWRISLTSSSALPTCSVEELWAGEIDDKAITPAVLAEAQGYRELPYASVLDWDILEHGLKVYCVLAGNPTLPPPSGLKEGDIISFLPIQPAAGGPYTVTYAANFDFGGITPLFSTIANRRDRMRGECIRESPILIDATHKKAGAT